MPEQRRPDTAAKPWTRTDLISVVFAMAFPTFVTLVYFQWLKDADSLVQQIAMGGGKILQFGFPVTWVWWRHRDKLQRPKGGNDAASFRKNLLLGIGFGAMVVVALYAVYFLWLAPMETGAKLASMVEEKVTGMGIDSFWKFLGLSLAYALVHTFMEEYYWRWFVFDFLEKFLPSFAANLLSSLGFMAHHVVVLAVYFGWDHPLTYLISGCVAIGGSFWAWQFKRTGSLLVPWISHLIVDAGIFSLGFVLLRDILV